MLRKPVLVNCQNGKPAKQNDYCGDPASWFTTEHFIAKGLNALSFDYIVDWENNRCQDELWVKRIICDDTDYSTLNKNEIAQKIIEVDGKSYPKKLLEFSNAHNLRLRYFLYRNIKQSDWGDLKNKIVSIDFSNYSHNNCIEIFNSETIQKEINSLRRKSRKMGSKGLSYATSTLEGYLSDKIIIWPGDVDTLLVDAENKVKVIIEFKKHTSYSKIPFDHQKIENYRDIDVLKYRSLGLLRDRFNAPLPPLLIIIYYSTEPAEREIIIEILTGPYDKLAALKRLRLPLPKQGNINSLTTFCEQFLNTIKLNDC